MLGRLPSQRRDALERTRLDLVSLASEIAVLTALLHQNLNSVDSHPEAEEIKHSCWQHRIAAMGLLSRETSFDELSVESLRKSVDVFRIRLEDVKDLQRSLEELHTLASPKSHPVSHQASHRCCRGGGISRALCRLRN
jgi:hypothetical protein